MNTFDHLGQMKEMMNMKWQERRVPIPSTRFWGVHHNLQALSGLEEDLVVGVVPAVTVVLEGRSICQRISLQKHGSYQSLAKALRHMFVDGVSEVSLENEVDLSNAVPGHFVAYEDFENDLLLAGDLNWKDFVRVAKRIRILPAKPNARKRRV